VKLNRLISHVLFLLLLALGSARAAPVDFSLPTLDGGKLSLSQFRGKWVVINFWATWCPPCREEIPDLEDFYRAHKDKDAVVLGINFEDVKKSQLKAFVDEFFISYPILLDPDQEPPLPGMDLSGLPTTYIVSPEGELVARQVGGITRKVIEDYIARKEAQRQAQARHAKPAK